MNNQLWSWILTIVGVTGFILAGRKVWWAWYINIGCQVLWFTYAIVTQQYGFIVAALVYTVVFTQNAIKWTREHRMGKDSFNLSTYDSDTGLVYFDNPPSNMDVAKAKGQHFADLKHSTVVTPTKSEDEIYEERLAEWHTHKWMPVYGKPISICLECPAVRDITDDTGSTRLD